MNKTNTVIQRILEVDNFQNVACGCAKIEFDDPELDVQQLDRFIFAENGYVREVA